MIDQLAGVRAKMARSFEHLSDLDDLMHVYLDSNPIDLQRQIQPDQETTVFALVVKEDPPLDLALRVGEVVYQLRSGLDHLANLLVRSAGNRPTRRTSFPILTKPPPLPLEVYGGVTPQALLVIEQLQPYQRRHEPKCHPLAVLNELWNMDKHRNLALTATMLTNSEIFVEDPQRQALFGGQFQTGPLADNDIVGVFRFKNGGPATDAEVQASGHIFVSFADPGPWGTARPVTEILEELHLYVTTNVLENLRSFC